MIDELTDAERRAALALFRCRAYRRKRMALRAAGRLAMLAALFLAAVLGDLVGAAGVVERLL